MASHAPSSGTPATRWVVIHADGLAKTLIPAAPEMSRTGVDGKTTDVGPLAYLAGKLLPALRAALPGATHLVTVLRDGVHPHRVALDPSYGRRPSPPPPRVVASFPALESFLRSLGGAALEFDEWRAPDLAATLLARGDAVGMVSKDRTARSLVPAGLRLYDPTSRTASPAVDVTYEVAVREAERLALEGYRPAGVAGVPGVGAVRAAALLDEHGSLDAVDAAWRDAGHPRAGAAPTARSLLEPMVAGSLPFPAEMARRDPSDRSRAVAVLTDAGLSSLAGAYARVLR